MYWCSVLLYVSFEIHDTSIKFLRTMFSFRTFDTVGILHLFIDDPWVCAITFSCVTFHVFNVLSYTLTPFQFQHNIAYSCKIISECSAKFFIFLFSFDRRILNQFIRKRWFVTAEMIVFVFFFRKSCARTTEALSSRTRCQNFSPSSIPKHLDSLFQQCTAKVGLVTKVFFLKYTYIPI